MSSSDRCTIPGFAPSRRAVVAGLFAGVALAAGVTGCGFRLRGDVSYAFATLYVTGPPSSPIVIELKRTLESSSGDARLVATPAEAQAILEITNVTDDKGVLSLSSGGRVREYLLTKRVAFNVHDAGGRDWLPAGEISIRRSYTFNESEVLAREVQEQRLLRDMQTDAVQQIVRRLQAAKKPVA
jgi:LPS-assembly lipoprotein